jgi:hypothetical protein
MKKCLATALLSGSASAEIENEQCDLDREPAAKNERREEPITLW